MSNRLPSGIMAGLTCLSALGAFASVRFARSVFLDLIARSGGNTVDQSRLTVTALGATSPALLLMFLLVTVAAVAMSEVFVKTPDRRLAIYSIVLLLHVLLLAFVLSGFFISFHIPEARIP